MVVLSADATPGQIDRLREAGADDYLTQPMDVRNLETVLNRAMEEEGNER